MDQNDCNVRDESQEKKPEKGASLVEYVLLVTFIAIVCITGVTFLGESLSVRYSKMGSALSE
jgi:Flp pilus assembly pilin Flp